MSLESGKKLGFAASIINIVVPVIMGIIFAVFYAALITTFISISRAPSGISVTPSFSAFFIPLIAVAVVGSALALTGYILFLIAMNRLSQYYHEHKIFSNILKALIIQIVVGVVVLSIIAVLVFISANRPPISPSTSTTTFFVSFFAVTIIAAIVGFVISIYCALLYKRSFDLLAEKSTVDSFRTTGLLYLIGAVLNIVGIGGILMWIAWIFAALGYRKLQPLPPVSVPFVPPYEPGAVAMKRCPTCGADNSPDAVYCRNCGRLL